MLCKILEEIGSTNQFYAGFLEIRISREGEAKLLRVRTFLKVARRRRGLHP